MSIILYLTSIPPNTAVYLILTLGPEIAFLFILCSNPPNTGTPDIISTLTLSGINISIPPKTAVSSKTISSVIFASLKSIDNPPNIASATIPFKSSVLFL